ncbi:hypothetical protein DJ66_0584 [Candidatus Liberibacter solanacearum]|uniref:Uncharacterized protein n=1 Tax=Candidatus Liberibacter solanacearum TaxID=556287 RepID=A0A0F4VMD9_9HYPH|nr:hypothetical protein DJ66_0584 [Candidatus Liberibacter solanacearum]
MGIIIHLRISVLRGKNNSIFFGLNINAIAVLFCFGDIFIQINIL